MAILSTAELEIRAELIRARRKFPSNAKLLHAFQEEAGEVTRAFLQLYESVERGNFSTRGLSDLRSDIRKELVQAAAMAIRLYEEGDPEFPEFDGSGIATPRALREFILRGGTAHCPSYLHEGGELLTDDEEIHVREIPFQLRAP